MTFKCLLLSKPSVPSYSLPYFWASAKTYYEENSDHVSNWEWPLPFIEYNSVDSVVSEIVKLNPTVVGFSLYVWNEQLFHDIARKLKKINDNIIIIFGGPQCDIKYNEKYFLDNPYVDLVVPGDAYGEIVLKEVLDSVARNNGTLNLKDVPYSYHPDTNRAVIYNNISIDKKGFKWPKNVFAAQEEHLLKYIKTIEKPVWVLIETSRGCPYKCSFCDWGGGIYTKTNKKDFSTVLGEIEWLAKNQIEGIFVTDANFGLFDIDIEYTKHIVKVKEQYGFPKRVLIQPAKSKIENIFAIYKLLSDAELIFHYKIAVEDINDHVLKNIDRVDFSFEEKIKMCKDLQANKNLPIFVEGIMGLPGSSIETMKSDIQKIISFGLSFPTNHVWMLLPETPAYAKEYREKFKLHTVTNKDYSSNINMPIKLKENFTADEGVLYNVVSDQLTTELVVGTMSYTPNDWVSMNTLQSIVAATYNTDILSLVSKYLHNTHSMNYGDFYNWIMNTMFLDSKQFPTLAKVHAAIDEWVNGDSVNIYCDYADDFPYTIAPVNYIVFAILVNSKEFFSQLAELLYVKTNDEVVYDLCEFSRNRLITVDYQFNKKFQTKFDWVHYDQTGQLTKQDKQYIIKDITVPSGGKDLAIDWDQFPNRLPHFLYRTCYDVKGSKLARNISEL